MSQIKNTGWDRF